MQESWEASEENYGGEKMKLHVEDEMRLGGEKGICSLCGKNCFVFWDIYALWLKGVSTL